MKAANLLRIALLLCSASVAGAGDWPQFKRDAARTGNAPDETLRIPLRRIMAVRLPAPIYASPAVVGAKVFIQDARGHVACIDSATNTAAWVTRIGGVANHSSPAVASGKVYVGSSAGHLAILDAVTGDLLRRVPGRGGVIASPAVANGAVYFSTFNGRLIKTDPDGNVIWTFDEADASNVELAVRGTEILFFAGPKGRDYRRGPKITTTVLYRLRDRGDRVEVLARRRVFNATGGPVFGRNGFYSYQSYTSEMGIHHLGTWDPAYRREKRWYRDHSWPVVDHCDSRVTLSVRGDLYFRGDLCLLARGTMDSRMVVWRAAESPIANGGFHSSPALAAKTMVIGSDDGRVLFFRIPKIDPADHPAAPGQARNIRVLLDRPDRAVEGKSLWAFSTVAALRPGRVNSAVSSSPAVAGGKVFFGGEDGIVYGLGPGGEVKVVDALIPEAYRPPERPGAKLRGLEWPTPGGGMGYSAVSPDRHIRPPFRLKWKTRIWGCFKAPLIVADGKVFGAGRIGQLVALDAESGEILWRTSHPGTESRSGAVYADGKLLVLRSTKNQYRKSNASSGLWCHDANTGRVLWHRPIPFAYHFNVDGLVAQEGQVGKVLACWNGGRGAVAAAAYRLDDGKEVWQRRYEGLLPPGRTKAFRYGSALGDGRWYFSFPATGSKRSANSTPGATVAVNIADGAMLWKNRKHFVYWRTRIGFRRGTLVVFNDVGGHALDPRTGKHLWSGGGPAGPHRAERYYMQPLSDVYLDSRGRRGVMPASGCTSSVYVNGAWYSHEIDQTPAVVARVETPGGGQPGHKVIWRQLFISRACPAPSPAYGRLYYTPNGEGVIYCFENAPADAAR